jgi:hypothetical protein
VEVRRLFAPEVDWNPALGWLTPTGCCLPTGRPPVCYEFICRAILDTQPSASERTRLETLAVLLTRAGRHAAGRRHLVELTDLHRLNAGRLLGQLTQARSVLEGLKRPTLR